MLCSYCQPKHCVNRLRNLACSLIGAAQIFISSTQADMIVDASLQAYWNAENGAVDATGKRHDGVFQGNAATITSEFFGKNPRT